MEPPVQPTLKSGGTSSQNEYENLSLLGNVMYLRIHMHIPRRRMKTEGDYVEVGEGVGKRGLTVEG